MSSVLNFGGITFRAGSAGVAIDRSYKLDATGEPWMETQRWDITVRMVKNSSIDTPIDTQVAQLEAAFSATRGSIKLVNANGSDSVHKSPLNLVGGVRVVKPPSYPEFQRGETITIRTATLSVEFLVPLVPPAYVIGFQEDTPIQAAGPVYKVMQPNVGNATTQRTRSNQHSTMTQSGTITFAGNFYPLPEALLPSNLLGPVQYSPGSPQRVGRGLYTTFFGFPVKYSYQFAAANTITALPTRWNG